MSNLLGVNFAFLTCKKPLSVERAGGKFFSLIIFLVGVFTREMPQAVRYGTQMNADLQDFKYKKIFRSANISEDRRPNVF